jgi:hypothetical protein
VTTVKFDIPQSGFTTVKIYDILGSEIATVYEGELSAGYYEAVVNASGIASGIYFYRLQSGTFSSVKRMVVIK